jgi:hypothetical protein
MEASAKTPGIEAEVNALHAKLKELQSKLKYPTAAN